MICKTCLFFRWNLQKYDMLQEHICLSLSAGDLSDQMVLIYDSTLCERREKLSNILDIGI